MFAIAKPLLHCKCEHQSFCDISFYDTNAHLLLFVFLEFRPSHWAATTAIARMLNLLSGGDLLNG